MKDIDWKQELLESQSFNKFQEKLYRTKFRTIIRINFRKNDTRNLERIFEMQEISSEILQEIVTKSRTSRQKCYSEFIL